MIRHDVSNQVRQPPVYVDAPVVDATAIDVPNDPAGATEAAAAATETVLCPFDEPQAGRAEACDFCAFSQMCGRY